MYFRTKTFTNKDGTTRQYLYLVKGVREGGRVRQKTIAYLGRLSRLQEEGALDRMAQSLDRYSNETTSIQVIKKLLQDWTEEYSLSSIFGGLWERLDLKDIFQDYVPIPVGLSIVAESRTEADSEMVSKIAERWGRIILIRDVVEFIVRVAAAEVEGLAEVKVVDTDTLESHGKEQRIKFSLKVTVRYGVLIPELAKQVQQNVIKRVKETTGFEVDSVDIHIQELEFPS